MPWDVSFVASFFMGSCRMDIQQGRKSGENSILMTLSLNKIIRLRIKSVDIFVNFAILMLITDGGRCIHGSVPPPLKSL